MYIDIELNSSKKIISPTFPTKLLGHFRKDFLLVDTSSSINASPKVLSLTHSTSFIVKDCQPLSGWRMRANWRLKYLNL